MQRFWYIPKLQHIQLSFDLKDHFGFTHSLTHSLTSLTSLTHFTHFTHFTHSLTSQPDSRGSTRGVANRLGVTRLALWLIAFVWERPSGTLKNQCVTQCVTRCVTQCVTHYFTSTKGLSDRALALRLLFL